MKRVYVASSWRNELKPEVVRILRGLGHVVYDFRNPPGATGFSWREVNPKWEEWTPRQYAEGLQHTIAKAVYDADMRGLETCDACVFVSPAGRSASWELGFAHGRGKHTYVLALAPMEPELMFRESVMLTSYDELRIAFCGHGYRDERTCHGCGVGIAEIARFQAAEASRR